jgi:hypothetical protein
MQDEKTFTISSPMVQSEDFAVAEFLENDQIKASTGWLDSFKKRHSIVWNGVCIGLGVKKIKADAIKKCFVKAGFGESDVVIWRR